MVTTRRKSAVNYKEETQVDEDGMKIDGDTSDSEDERPVRKKPRTSNGKGKGKVTVRALMKDFFDVLPLDIIFEIFGHLQPLDLLQLARTNKMLRSHLMSKARGAFTTVAKHSLTTSLSPRQVCGTKKIQKVDWNLRFRGCETCFKKEIVYGKTAFKRYPEIDDIDTVLQVLPYSHVGGWAHGHKSSGKFYFSGAIEAMSEVVENYQTRIDAGIKGAQEEMDKFIAERKEEVAEILEHADTCHEWEHKTRQQKNDTNAQLRAERKKAINDRLAALGHDQRDIDSMQWNPIFYSTTKVTDRLWDKSLKAQAEEIVSNHKTGRLADERRNIINQRKAEARKTWQEFKNTNEVSNLCPGTEEILLIDPFAAIINRPSEDTVTKADFDAVAPSLPAAIIDWQAKKKADILRSAGKADEDPAVLDLATTCFICSTMDGTRNPGPIFHVDEWLRDHTHRSPWSYQWTSGSESWACLRFNAKASEIVRGLVEAVGLNPESATPKDMDDTDARFYCSLCSGGDEHLARTWRGLARHCTTDHPDVDPAYTRLSDGDALVIKRLELRNLDDTARRFRPLDAPSRSLMTLSVAVGHARAQQRWFSLADFDINPTWPPTPVKLTDNFPSLPAAPQANDNDDAAAMQNHTFIFTPGSDV